MAEGGGGTTRPHNRVGRRRDDSRDTAILDATTDLLAEIGYANLTIDVVAARARAGKATVYRRWSSKEDLVLAVVARLEQSQVDLDRLPDTGTVRGDLIALFTPDTDEQAERRGRALAALASVLSHPSIFAKAAHDAVVTPYAEAHRRLMRRAVDRGEVPARADVDTLCQVLPVMAAYRALVQRAPFTRAFLVSSIDRIVLPALFHPPGPDPSTP